jgi:HAAS
MTSIDQYLADLRDHLHVRGRVRRRFLSECREHLIDASAAHGEAEAVRMFGSAAELATSFQTEVAARRGMRDTMMSMVAVVAVAFSVLTIVNAVSPQVTAAPLWAVVFFVSAQTSAVAAVLAALRASATRHLPASAADVALLSRRNITALSFAVLCLLAAGGAVPGNAPPWRLLIGPIVAVCAAVGVLSTHRLVRKVDGPTTQLVREPLNDLRAVLHPSGQRSGDGTTVSSTSLLVVTVIVAAVAAFLWDHLDGGTSSTSIRAATLEVVFVICGFVVLGPALGLRRGRRGRRATTA